MRKIESTYAVNDAMTNVKKNITNLIGKEEHLFMFKLHIYIFI